MTESLVAGDGRKAADADILPGQTRLEMRRASPTSAEKTPEKTLGKNAGENAIRKLRSAGRLVRVGPDKGGSWKVIELKP